MNWVIKSKINLLFLILHFEFSDYEQYFVISNHENIPFSRIYINTNVCLPSGIGHFQLSMNIVTNDLEKTQIPRLIWISSCPYVYFERNYLLQLVQFWLPVQQIYVQALYEVMKNKHYRRNGIVLANDSEKTFNLISWELILEKISFYVVRRVPQKFLGSHLYNRTHCNINITQVHFGTSR